MTRTEIAALTVQRIKANEPQITTQYATQNYFVVDDLLPEALAHSIYQSFPDPSTMMLRKSLRELKYVTSQMNKYAPLLEEVVYAFQDPGVVAEVSRVTKLKEVEADAKLYAGGISLMGPGHYLHPHLDNSHDMTRQRYRILNLLYYTSPDWKVENGGNLELWPNGPKAEPHTIHSKFNRLLVIGTNQNSWHSVSKVRANRNRTCVSNYYFSKVSPDDVDYFHVTSFRGRPEEPAVVDLLLRGDAVLRSLVRRLAPTGVKQTKHYYKKEK